MLKPHALKPSADARQRQRVGGQRQMRVLAVACRGTAGLVWIVTHGTYRLMNWRFSDRVDRLKNPSTRIICGTVSAANPMKTTRITTG